LMDFSLPTNRGTIIEGNTTMSLNGNVGIKSVLLIFIYYMAINEFISTNFLGCGSFFIF